MGQCFPCFRNPHTVLDKPREDPGAQLKLSNRYSALLETSCSGHALFGPRESKRDGSIGDVGYIERGYFTKLFNVFDKPSEYSALPIFPDDSIAVDHLDNTDVMKSSRATILELTLADGTGSTALPLPLTFPPAAVNVSVKNAESGSAFLCHLGPSRVREVLKRPCRDELLRWTYTNYKSIRQRHQHDVVVITEVTRASGWVGGVAYGPDMNASGNVTVGSPGGPSAGVNVGASSIAHEVQHTRGPPDWKVDAENPQLYTTVIAFIVVRRNPRLFKSPPPPRINTPPGRMRGGASGLQAFRVGRAPSESPVSAGSEEQYESTLNALIDKSFEDHPEAEFICGDWSIVSDYIAAHGECPDRNSFKCKVEKETLPDGTVVFAATEVIPPNTSDAEPTAQAQEDEDLDSHSSLMSLQPQAKISALRIDWPDDPAHWQEPTSDITSESPRSQSTERVVAAPSTGTITPVAPTEQSPQTPRTSTTASFYSVPDHVGASFASESAMPNEDVTPSRRGSLAPAGGAQHSDIDIYGSADDSWIPLDYPLHAILQVVDEHATSETSSRYDNSHSEHEQSSSRSGATMRPPRIALTQGEQGRGSETSSRHDNFEHEQSSSRPGATTRPPRITLTQGVQGRGSGLPIEGLGWWQASRSQGAHRSSRHTSETMTRTSSQTVQRQSTSRSVTVRRQPLELKKRASERRTADDRVLT
ncbi:hypothetical protein EXIGLDRAFT_172346 [Exidia glandulosa HHB12029]|uniref:Uncharacterized protein n=1 Tax=Exidia glandulosa HHB12029 TaxID=1314781 RepID=A0A165FA74_EXIGL|nr:hypothetical protein EXIGLDRAFT_172346 [Exidia glandulosa HHB12029]